MNSHNTQGPMTLFRIFVEDIGDRNTLRELVRNSFVSGATISYGEGFWEGQREQVAIIEVYGAESLRGTINVLATKLRVAFNQKVVAVAEHNDRVSFYQV